MNMNTNYHVSMNSLDIINTNLVWLALGLTKYNIALCAII